MEAEQAYTRAVELDPNYKDAQDELLRTKVERMKVPNNANALRHVGLRCRDVKYAGG